MRSRLAKEKIAAEDGESRGVECARQGDEKRRIAVRSRAVGQDEAIPTRTGGAVKETSNGYLIRRSVQKFSIVVHGQDRLEPMAALVQIEVTGGTVVLRKLRTDFGQSEEHRGAVCRAAL
jgi:hypothetical protein